MSTIFGLFLQDQRKIQEVVAEKMTTGMNHWKADEAGFLMENNLMMGHLMLHNTPESFAEKLPLRYEHFWITADARIDNREKIIQLLKEFRQISSESPDSSLILFLYIKFGKSCLDFITGDFAFAIWDPKKSELFCARDQMGIKPLFYYAKDKVFAFASEVKGILAVESVDKSLNKDFILRLIGDSFTPPAATFYENIQVLLPGHYLVIDQESVTKRKYWTLLIPPLLKLNSAGEYIEAFREELDIAVKCRMRTVFPIAAELSGGLDSSGITALAARLISDKSRLHTFSNVMPKDDNGIKEYDDEEIYIDEVIRFCKIQNSVKVSHSGWRSIFEPFELELFVNSGVTSYSAIWQEPLRRIMEEKGIRVTLSGFGGDEVITNKGDYYYFDYLYEGEYAAFVKTSFQKDKYTLPLKMFLRYLTPKIILQKINRDHRVKFKRNSYLLDDEFEEKLIAEDDRDSKINSRRYKVALAGKFEFYSTFQRFQSESSYSIMHKLEPRYPYADIRLISFFLSLPTFIIGNPFMNRYMYRRSMDGILPEIVRTRNDKTRAAAGTFILSENRLNSNELMDWINSITVKESDIYLKKINLKKMVLGYDPTNQENFQNQLFIPKRPFQIECLVNLLNRKAEL
jgi:asparagine synthase (glutamine-hydrolysing)